MAQRREEFIVGEIYHITLKGIDGRSILMDDEDYWRFIFSLYEFNNSLRVAIRKQRETRNNLKIALKLAIGVNREKLEKQLNEDKRDKLVEIMEFILMPNHVHLGLKEIRMGGISNFMQKIGSGYSHYFNTRYRRTGHLFQDKFQATRISGDEYLKTVFVYIHANPISLIEPGWKEKGVRDVEAAIKFLESYRWSSYMDYIGKKNFPSITDREFMLKAFGGAENAKKFVDTWIRHKHTLAE